MKLGKKLSYTIGLVLMMVALLATAYFIHMDPPSEGNVISTGAKETVKIQLPKLASLEDYYKLEQILPNNEIIQKLPDKAKIQLTFFNRAQGYWEEERSYVLIKGYAIEGKAEDVDMKLVMHSAWLSYLDETNFCRVVQYSKANGDFDAQLLLSKTKFLWKYKSVIGYRECLGF